MGRLAALLSAAALMAVATGAAATTSPPGPTPTPKTMKITKDSGEECISKWFVTGNADGKWVWADVDICCPPRPMTKTMIVFRGGKRCTSTWAPCDRELNAASKCVWKICDVTDCVEPVESASRVPPLSMTAGMPRFHLSVRLRLPARGGYRRASTMGGASASPPKERADGSPPTAPLRVTPRSPTSVPSPAGSAARSAVSAHAASTAA